MQATRTAIADVFLLEPRVFGDARGFFYESFNARAFAEANSCAFVLTSAKSNTNVDEAFEGIIRQFLDGPDHLRRKPKPINKDLHGHITPVHTAPKPSMCACL